MIAIVTMLFYLVFSSDLNFGGPYMEYFRIATHVLFWLVSILTLFSGFYYLVKYKSFYLDNA